MRGATSEGDTTSKEGTESTGERELKEWTGEGESQITSARDKKPK